MKKVKKPTLGTILVHSIGWGCDIFYQVVAVTPKSVMAKKLDPKVVNRNVQCQTCDYLPVKDRFEKNETSQDHLVKLMVKEDGQIGPIKRCDGWHIWNGKAQEQYSP